MVVTGAWQGTNTEKIYEDLGWESLSKRRWFRRLIQIFKIQNNLTPNYLKGPIPSPRTYTISTHGGNLIHLVNDKTDYYRNSFFPDAISIWNNSDHSLRKTTSLSTFKSNILKILRPTMKSIFNIHDPKGTMILFQLRVGFSPLREHKRRHNFRDTPSDACNCQNDVETTSHFLLHCNLYAGARNSLNNDINSLLESKELVLLDDGQRVKFRLYGHDLNLNENKGVLSVTLKYFHDSKRF